MTGLRLQPLTAGDSAGLADLDARCSPYPWSGRQYQDSLAARHFGWGWCNPDPREWVGLALLDLVLDEASLLNLVIAPAWRRRGLARRLLQHACREVQLRGARSLLLEVRASNQGAIALYRQLGFVISGVRRGYYPGLPARPGSTANTGEREDALLMHCPLPVFDG